MASRHVYAALTYYYLSGDATAIYTAAGYIPGTVTSSEPNAHLKGSGVTRRVQRNIFESVLRSVFQICCYVCRFTVESGVL